MLFTHLVSRSSAISQTAVYDCGATENCAHLYAKGRSQNSCDEDVHVVRHYAQHYDVRKHKLDDVQYAAN